MEPPGQFDINLPLNPPFGVECRTGGAGNNHQVLVTFANPVTLDGVSVTSSDGLATAAQSVSGAVVTVDLAAVANAQILGITLINVRDGTSAGDVLVPFRVLIGDTTQNSSVTASDIGQVKAQSGQPVDLSNFRLDVSANGAIDSTDIGLVKIQLRHAAALAVRLFPEPFRERLLLRQTGAGHRNVR